jgi:hypothetical protein
VLRTHPMIMPPDHPTRQRGARPRTPPSITFAQEVLQRLPLAEAALALFAYGVQPPFLHDLYDRCRGRCYEQLITFPQLVTWLFEALVEHHGSGRQAHLQRVRTDDDACNEAFYGKLRRLPLPLSVGFLREVTQRFQRLYPNVVNQPLPSCFDAFDTLLLDGKNLKKVAKRLRETRGTPGKLLGGKLLVAYQPHDGLILDMAVDPDGERNEARLVTTLLPLLHAREGRPKLIVADRLFCKLTHFAAFTETDGHFIVRYAPPLSFTPDPQRPARTSRDASRRTITEDWGWAGRADHPQRRYVRRLTVAGSSDGTMTVLTDLLDHERYPAAEVLALYRVRWSIEGSFQQVTQLFALDRFIGATVEATVFQAALCFVLANLVQVLKGFVVETRSETVADVSTHQVLKDWQRDWVALKQLVPVSMIVTLIPAVWTEGEIRALLQRLLTGLWQPGWTKTHNKKERPHTKRVKQRSAHNSVYRRRQAYKKASGP